MVKLYLEVSKIIFDKVRGNNKHSFYIFDQFIVSIFKGVYGDSNYSSMQHVNIDKVVNF